MKKCFFIGHREANDEIYAALVNSIDAHITKRNVSEFIVGLYGGFDLLARRVLIEAKQRYPYIRITALMPYHPSERNGELPRSFDGSIYPEGLESVPRRYAIVRANRYMIDHVDYLVAYVTHPASNAYNLLEYASRRAAKGKLNITNIGEYENPTMGR